MLVSVVVPTYNRPKGLKRCLEALLEQDMEEPWEIVVVDDGSKMDLWPVIEEVNSSGLIRFYRQSNAGPAKARNKGVKLAKGKYVAFTDDDCAPLPDWLSNHRKYFQKGVITGGKTVNGIEGNLYSESSQLLIDYLYRFFVDTKMYFFTSNNFSMDRDTFLAVGGFDESFPTSAGEDRELCVRWIHLGYKLKFVHEAQVRHYHYLNLKTFYKLHFKYGTAAVPFYAKMNRIEADLTTNQRNFYNKLLKYPFQSQKFNLWQQLQLVAFLAISQIANGHGHLYEKYLKKKSVIPK